MKIVSFTSRDGTNVGCHVAGRGTPLVLVHGGTADHTRWIPLVSSLEQRFTVYALDRRGRGASGDAAAYALEREIDDVAAIVDGIGGPVDLLGHSFGALVSLETAARVANLRRLVLYEPPIETGTPLVAPSLIARLDALIAAGERDAAVATFLTEGPRVPAHELAAMRSLAAWAARVAAVHTIPRELRAVAEYKLDASRFTGLRAPTLLLLGGASPPPFRAAVELVHAAIPHAELRVLPGQQHVAIDTAPDMFLRELLTFLTNE
jgi:pimeloyl-ACP methyl ester carboxylesterase